MNKIFIVAINMAAARRYAYDILKLDHINWSYISNHEQFCGAEPDIIYITETACILREWTRIEEQIMRLVHRSRIVEIDADSFVRKAIKESYSVAEKQRQEQISKEQLENRWFVDSSAPPQHYNFPCVIQPVGHTTNMFGPVTADSIKQLNDRGITQFDKTPPKLNRDDVSVPNDRPYDKFYNEFFKGGV